MIEVQAASSTNGHTDNNSEIRLFVQACCSKAQAVVDAYLMGAQYVIRTFQKELSHLEK